MSNAVIYARFSSYSQTEQSIEGQLRVCKEYAEKHKINIIAEYIDRAMTGRNDNRPQFQQMIEDAKKREFEYVLVYKLDRFSRDKYDNAIYKHKLKECGVKVISATEIITDTPEGVLMEGMLEMFAEMYSKDLSQKVKRGIRESILKGNYIGGYVPFGYKVVDKKILIDEEKAPAIRYLFTEYANGKSKKQITEELHKKGFTKINCKSLQNTLVNKKYIGEFNNGIVENNDYYPAIVDKDTFEKVQIKLQENKHAPATERAKVEYLLTGKLFCGHCGLQMVGKSGTSKTGIKHYYYACYNRITKHLCDKKHEKKEELENCVIVQALDYIFQPENIEEIANGILLEWNESKTALKIQELENKIKRIDRELDNIFNKFLKTDSVEMQKRLNEQANSYELQKQDIEQEIKKLKLTQTIIHTKEEVKVILNHYLKYNKDDLTFKKKIINGFINSVYVYDDKLVVYYNVFGNKKRTFEEVQADLKKSGESSHIKGTAPPDVSNPNP